MTLEDITPEQKARILPLLREAARLFARRWDVESQIEEIVGEELYGRSADYLSDLAANIEIPAENARVDFITLEEVDGYLEAAFSLYARSA